GTRRAQRPVGEPLAYMVDDAVIDGSRLPVGLQHPAHAGRPADQVPPGKLLAGPEEDIAGKDPPLPAVSDATRLGPRRRREARGVALHVVQPQVFAYLRLTVRRHVRDVPHKRIRTIGVAGKRRVRRGLPNGYKMFSWPGTLLSYSLRRAVTRSAKTGSSPHPTLGRAIRCAKIRLRAFNLA